MDDLALLKSYADSGSEEAFRDLVARHVAIVYSAARRQAGDSFAADVTQAVFLILARKAGKLRSNTVLTAWLLTTTRLVSRATLRSENRRQHWEQEAANMPLNYEQIEIQSAWEKVRPMLDDAVAALPEKDRGLVALRFFEQKSHAEIAAALGLTEEASKKRLSRAVERLRTFFSKRGATLGVVALLAAISQNALQAAPAGLVSQITSAASGAGVSASVAALVKTTLKLMTWIKIKIAGASAGALLVVASVPVIATLSASDSAVVKTDGREAKLERYEFKTAPVRYTYPTSKAQPTVGVLSPAFAGEPLLSAEFSWQVGPAHPRAEALRIAVADEQGNEFDPVVQNMAGMDESDVKQYWVGDVPVFPRRGKEVRLRVLNDGNLLAEFKIPNPAPGPHPDWTALAWPVRAISGDLEVTLTEFSSCHPSSESASKEKRHARTECVFNFRENNRETGAWRPVMLELADATGNHWRPERGDEGNPYRAKVENGAVRTEFYGALWPAESVWKLRGEFKRVAEFPENELLRISKIRIPDAKKVSEPLIRYDWSGANVELAAVIGTDVAFDTLMANDGSLSSEERMRRGRVSNAERRGGCVTVVLAGEILSRNRRLTFVGATDEQGHSIELAGFGEPGNTEYSKLAPYSFVFRAPEGARELNLIVAVSESRFLEFLAKPEQMSE